MTVTFETLDLIVTGQHTAWTETGKKRMKRTDILVSFLTQSHNPVCAVVEVVWLILAFTVVVA